MNRREFSTMLGLGAATLAGGVKAADTQAQPIRLAAAGSGKMGPEKVSRVNRMQWARENFRGFENILMASFTPDLKDLDEAGIRLDVRQSIANGFFSTLCAPPALTTDEMKRFLAIVVDEAGRDIEVGLALNAPTEAEMFDIMEYAEKIGCQHFLLDLPRSGSAEELIAYGRRFSEATNMGIYLWMAFVHDFKRFHPSAIPFEIFDALAPEPNIIALKVGNMDPAVIFQLFERYNEDMLIGALWPNVMPLAIRAYNQQWSGAWTVEALQSPAAPYGTEFFNLMMGGEYDKGMKLYWEHVAPGFGMMMKMMGKYMAKGGHPWEHFKYYQFLGGGNGGRYRVDPEFPDLPRVTAEDMAFMQNSFRVIGVPMAEQISTDAFEVGRVNFDKGIRASRT